MATSNLKEIDIPVELSRIESMGFIQTRRVGDTGVGYTLETLLGLRETNKQGVQDFSYKGIPTELKSQRKTTTSMITLFTKEPAKGVYKDRAMIDKYGYTDKKGRKALKVRCKIGSYNPQGLSLSIDDSRERLCIIDAHGSKPWQWNIDHIKPKINSLVIVTADKTGSKRDEKFHYQEAYHLTGLDIDQFWDMFTRGTLVIEPRMHIKHTGQIRNRGTAIRVKGLKSLFPHYDSVDKIL